MTAIKKKLDIQGAIPLNHEQSQICSHIILSTVIPKGENHASVLQIFLLIIKWFLPETESVRIEQRYFYLHSVMWNR